MSIWTNRGLYELATQDVESATLMAALVATTATESTIQDWNFVDDALDDANTTEVDVGTVTSYARQSLTNVAVTEDDTSNEVTIDFDDVEFGALEAGATPNALLVYREVEDDEDSPLWMVLTFSSTPTNGSTYTVQIPSNGAAVINHAS